MPISSRQWYYLTDTQLAKLVGQGQIAEAPRAWDRLMDINHARGKPAIYFSEASGFLVFDANDARSFPQRLSISQHAKPFPG